MRLLPFLRHLILTLPLLLILEGSASFAQQLGDGDLLTRVIDTGSGHASVTAIPGGHYMVYDTGHWNHDNHVLTRVQEVVPAGETIDLLVLSHSDSDHLAATDEILQNYTVRMILRTGLERTTGTWGDAESAINQARAAGTAVFDLGYLDFEPGTGFQFGETTITFLSGHYWPTHYSSIFRENGTCRDLSKCRNAGSIVLRLEYAGRSILFTGDAVGRLDDTPANTAPIATEAEILGRSGTIPVDSDVLIAAHHGADNANSANFITAVSPEWVIFPAGAAHEHPKQTTADRVLAAGVALDHILRTDLGSNGGGDEWDHGNTTDGDVVGDDDVDIIIRANGTLEVGYRAVVGGVAVDEGGVTAPIGDAATCRPRSECTRVCRMSQACGNGCIGATQNCTQAQGTACNLSEICPGT